MIFTILVPVRRRGALCVSKASDVDLSWHTLSLTVSPSLFISLSRLRCTCFFPYLYLFISLCVSPTLSLAAPLVFVCLFSPISPKVFLSLCFFISLSLFPLHSLSLSLCFSSLFGVFIFSLLFSYYFSLVFLYLFLLSASVCPSASAYIRFSHFLCFTFLSPCLCLVPDDLVVAQMDFASKPYF